MMIWWLHNLWCAITKKCRVRIADDSYMEWLRNQERSSRDATELHRQRRNFLEQELVRKRQGHDL